MKTCLNTHLHSQISMFCKLPAVPSAFMWSPKKLFAFVTVSTVKATGTGEFNVYQSLWGWTRLPLKHQEDLSHNECREEVNHQREMCKHNSKQIAILALAILLSLCLIVTASGWNPVDCVIVVLNCAAFRCCLIWASFGYILILT